MNIGAAAKASGLPAKTIRYYEDIGLITPDRKANAYRDYSDDHVHKLRFIQRARSLGFSVEDCRQLLSLYEDTGRASSDVKLLAQEHLSEIERKITELTSMHDVLNHLVKACRGDNRPDCPIIDRLAK
ncbi:MAG: Cu(I)-responsive transcriptional regulator [Pseudomonadota bacterium]